MIIAIVGSRGIMSDISQYIPPEMSVLISGGAAGVDSSAERYADERMIPKLILRPDYTNYGKYAPLVRNEEIVDVAEMVVAIWDGKSRGTRYTIDYALSIGKPVVVHKIE